MQSLSDETTNVLQRQCFHLEMQDMIDLAELVDAINPIYVIILGVLIAAGENSSSALSYDSVVLSFSLLK